ncbi:hypothetical protein BJV82DRAFT_377562 [Fennellomyces sp. T-0311]|nr:hypothetical protein BJV82DRAFT_377562 [Fennellomyces sp. T-0311]
MTGAMMGLAERQQIKAAVDDEEEWATAVENQFSDYKAQMQRLERELTSNNEKLRLESMSVKKYEMQLRIMQEKRDAAEAKYRDMEKKYLDRELDVDSYVTTSNNTSPASLELENSLAQAKQDLQRSQEQVSSLQVSLAEMEVRCTKAESEAAASAAREIAADARMEKYQNEASALRAEKQRWERALKRESVLQMMEGGSDSFKAKYEQQLEEQRQEYEAELQEQRAFLAKTTRAQQQAEADRDKMSAVCKDLEDLIRDKSRTIDARDVRINVLEDEMKELRLQKPLPRTKNEEVERAQKAFTEREQAWLAQSASMEADFEGIMKEFDRLTVAAMEFETDRMKYEQRIDQLTRDLERVEAELTEAKIDKLGYGDKEGPTTASLRKEFRQLVSNLKSDHQRLNERQVDERKALENKLKDLKHELETSRYERVNRGVQTNFVV